MLKQNLKDGDLNTMWSGGVAGTNSYKTWSLRPWRWAMSSIAAMASSIPPRSEVDCRLATPWPGWLCVSEEDLFSWNLLALWCHGVFCNVWCPSPTHATKPLDRPCPQSDQCASNTSFKHVRCNPDIATRLTSGGYEDTVDVITPSNILFIGGGNFFLCAMIMMIMMIMMWWCDGDGDDDDDHDVMMWWWWWWWCDDVMVMVMVMVMLMMMMMMMRRTTVSVEHRPGWGEHPCNPDVAPRLTSGGYEDTVDVITPTNILFIGGGKCWPLMKIKLMLLPQPTYCSEGVPNFNVMMIMMWWWWCWWWWWSWSWRL